MECSVFFRIMPCRHQDGTLLGVHVTHDPAGPAADSAGARRKEAVRVASSSDRYGRTVFADPSMTVSAVLVDG